MRNCIVCEEGAGGFCLTATALSGLSDTLESAGATGPLSIFSSLVEEGVSFDGFSSLEGRPSLGFSAVMESLFKYAGFALFQL